MASTKRKAVINADASQLDRIRPLIDAGKYRTLSEFVREAMGEKLQRLERETMASAVESYCAAGYADDDTDLIVVQAFGRRQPKRPAKGVARAKR